MKLKHWIPKSVGTRFMLAFATVGLLTLMAAGFACHIYVLFRQRLAQIRAEQY